MEDNYFYKKFLKNSDSELQKILNDPESYSEEAILASSYILKERKIDLSDEEINVTAKIEENNIEKKRLKEKREIPSFLHRSLAFIIDITLLSALSYILGFLLMTTQLLNEPWESIISLSLIIGYFSIFNSDKMKGTLGKKILKIEVLNYNLKPLSMKESLIRYSILVMPYFLFEYLETTVINTFSSITALNYCYYFAIIYFMITDKVLRRSYHDFLTKSFTRLHKDTKYSFDYPLKGLKTFYIISTVVIIVLAIPSILTYLNPNRMAYIDESGQLQLSLEQNMATFESLMNQINSIEDVSSVEGIAINTTNGYTVLNITIKPTSFQPIASLNQKVYDALLGKTFHIEHLHEVKIIQKAGFNMTLASFNNISSKSFPQ